MELTGGGIDTGTIYLFGAGVLLALASLVHSVYQGPLSHLPGPWYTRFTNIVLTYKWLKGKKALYIHQLHKKYGPVVRISPTEVDFTDIGAKQQIYSTKETFRKSPWYQLLVGERVQNIFSTQDLEFHRRHRRLLSGPLSESSLKSFEPLVHDRVTMAIDGMAEEMRGGKGFADVYKWALFMTTDVIGELTFGESFKMLERGEKNQYSLDLETVAFAGCLRSAFPRVVYFVQRTKIPTPIKTLNRVAAAGRNIVTYAIQSMGRYRDMVERDPDNVQPTLFTKMFKGEDADALTFAEIRDAAQSYIVAGSDTTAHTLTFLIWSVSRNPQIRDRLAKEVQALSDEFVEHDLWTLPYLNQVIEETLRLYSAAPSTLPRVVPPQGAELAGYNIKGGVTVSSQAYSLHRNPEVFPEPDEFIPSRWEQPTKAMKDSFMPFGGGSRVCIGLHLARMELRLAAAIFFRRFPKAKVSTAEGMCDQDMEPYIYFLLTPRGKRLLIEES